MADQRTRSARTLVATLFFFSGVTGLVYQIVWVRMLLLVLGTSVHAVATVLAAFMGGLALGSLLLGRIADRRGDALAIYGWLELGLGAVALALLPLFAALDELYTAAYRLLEHRPFAFALFRFALTSLVLLVPTTLMGGTLPLLGRHLVRRLSQAAGVVGVLYAANTAGAVVGSVLVGFVLLESLGLERTVYLTAASNALIGSIAVLLGRRRAGGETPPTGTGAGEPALGDAVEVSAPPRLRRIVPWAYALCGFAALGHEVVWTRMVATVLRLTTSRTLAAILIVFLFGLAAGGAVGSWLVRRVRSAALWFGGLAAALAASAAASILVIAELAWLQEALGPAYTRAGYLIRLAALVLAVMGLPTLLMGMLFPLAVRLHLGRLGAVGRGVGTLYAANTAGAILGATSAGFLLLPVLGSQRSVLALAAVQLAASGLALASSLAGGLALRAALLAVGLLPVAGLSLGLPAGEWLASLRPRPDSRLLYFDEGAGGSVSVVEYGEGERLLSVNGAGEVPTDRASIRVFRLLGSLPLLLHAGPEEVLVIAFGGGVTLAAVEQQGPRRIECVELVDGVLEAAPLFSRYNNGVEQRVGGPTIGLVRDDGRNHVLRTDRRYDVIISDSTHPRSADSWVLYTREFYALCARRLREGGIMAQWLPLHGLDVEDYRTIVRTFRSAFPHTSLWLTARYSVLLGTPGELRIDYEELGTRLARPEALADLEEVGLGDARAYLATLALDGPAVERWVGAGPINTDDLPRIAFGDRSEPVNAGGLPVLASLLPALIEEPQPAVRVLDAEEASRLRRRLAARRHQLAAALASRSGDRERAIAELDRALALDPEETEAIRLLGFLRGEASVDGEP